MKTIKNYKRRLSSKQTLGIILIAPSIIIFLIFIAFPTVQSFAISFFKWDGSHPWEFVGLKNYINMFTRDPYFFTSLKNSIIYSLVYTLGVNIMGFTIAVILDLKVRFWKIYRFIFFLPVTLSIMAMGLLWSKVFERYGLLNSILNTIGINVGEYAWLGNRRVAFLIIMFVSIWQFFGYPMVFYLAGLSNINPEIYEAAEIDGASLIRKIFAISIPMLKNIISIVVVLNLIISFKVFDIVWIMTMGGPAGVTEVLGTQLYKKAFVEQSFGRGSVIAVIMFIVCMILALIFVKFSGYSEPVFKKERFLKK